MKKMGLAALVAICAPSALAQSVVVMGEDAAASVAAANCEVVAEIGALNILRAECDAAGVEVLRADTGVVAGLSPAMNFMGGDEAEKQTVTDQDEDLRFLQWNLDAVEANAAWDRGYTGAGVRVAVLDEGLFPHPDLMDNVNVGLAASAVPFEDVWSYNDFNHGTHVAGIIAAGDNGFGTIGIAPNAEIVPVKVLSVQLGYGDFFWIWDGMIYAALIDADIINMSLGAVIPRNGFIDELGNHVTAGDIQALFTISNAVANFVHAQGTAIITAAGNDSIDFDKSAALWSVPSQFPHTIGVSATGPTGFALGQTDYDTPAFYTNYGNSLVTVGAPGGNVSFDLYPDGPWFFDLVLSTVPFGGAPDYGWSAGTSMACPAAAGVAALVVEKNGGDMDPDALRTALTRGADRLRPREFYGAGAVNANGATR